MNRTYITQSPAQTKKLAKELVQFLLSKRVICFYGELGSGKTTLIQGLAEILRIKRVVQSPTFVLVREYKIKKEISDLKNLIHIDCYRIESEKDIKGVDLKEIWQDKRNLVVIEWAERIKKVLPKERIDICLNYLSDKKRKITIFQP